MNASQIKTLVDRALALDREIADKTDQLAELKAELITIAGDKEIEKTKTECGGWSVVLLSSDCDIARVTKPADKLKSGLAEDSDEWGEVKALLGPLRMIMFSKKPAVYAPAENIREALHSIGVEKRRRVLKLITSKTKPTVSFETKEAA